MPRKANAWAASTTTQVAKKPFQNPHLASGFAVRSGSRAVARSTPVEGSGLVEGEVLQAFRLGLSGNQLVGFLLAQLAHLPVP